MFNVGTPEILVILIIALVVFGPKKLPEIGKSIGQGLRELRRASRSVMDTFEDDNDYSYHKKELTQDDTNSDRNT